MIAKDKQKYCCVPCGQKVTTSDCRFGTQAMRGYLYCPNCNTELFYDLDGIDWALSANAREETD